jgi:Uma2 family endonuclease
MMSSVPGTRRPLPAVDARLVAGESGYEIVEGRVVAVPPALEPHGQRHSKVNAVLEAFVAADYDVACDMLTRTSETTDIAPDASVYPVVRDPVTGGRLIEHLAFEVVSTQALGDAGDKARRLSNRGVRRVFAVDVAHQRVHEWSPEADGWRVLADAAVIEDPVFVVPLPVAALVKAAKADDAMATALLAKQNPVLVAAGRRLLERGVAQGLEQGLEQGRDEGLEFARASLLDLLDARGLSPIAEQRARIETCRDFDQLRAWTLRAATATTADAVFDP